MMIVREGVQATTDSVSAQEKFIIGKMKRPWLQGGSNVVWHLPPVVATSAVASTTTGAFYLAGGTLGALFTAFLPDGPPGSRTVLFVLCAIALALGAVSFLTRSHFTARKHHVLIALATIIVSAAVFAATSDVAAVSIAVFYTFIACDAAFMFAPNHAALHCGGCAVGCIAAMSARSETPAWIGVIPAGTAVVVGVVVAVLARLAAQADIDPLTGLLNRRGLTRAIAALTATAERLGSRPALIMLNLDRFHTIPERPWTDGNLLLRRVSTTWAALLSDGDILARLEADQFAVLLPDRPEDEAIAMADLLREEAPISCSAGVAVWFPGESASVLIGRAEMGLYRAKVRGRDRTILEPADELHIADEISDVVEAGRIPIYYQPIVKIQDHMTVVGVEAHVQWPRLTRRHLLEEEVLQAAQSAGLLMSVSSVILRQACSDALQLQTALGRTLMLSIDLSGQELMHPDLPRIIDDVLSSHPWPSSQLVLEIPEPVMAALAGVSAENLFDLRDRGICVAIDHFGSSTIPMNGLWTRHVDFIKLDAMVSAGGSIDPSGIPMLEMMAMLGRALDTPIIVQAVSDEDQEAAVRGFEFTFAEGPLYGEPVPVDALTARFRSAN